MHDVSKVAVHDAIYSWLQVFLTVKMWLTRPVVNDRTFTAWVNTYESLPFYLQSTVFNAQHHLEQLVRMDMITSDVTNSIIGHPLARAPLE